MSWNYRNKFATTSESGPEQDLEADDLGTADATSSAPETHADSSSPSSSTPEGGEAQSEDAEEASA